MPDQKVCAELADVILALHREYSGFDFGGSEQRGAFRTLYRVHMEAGDNGQRSEATGWCMSATAAADEMRYILGGVRK